MHLTIADNSPPPRLLSQPTRRQLVFGLAGAIAGAGAQAREPGVIPLLSTAAPGPALAPGWQHQTLPKVERPNQFEIVMDEARRVLQVRSDASASSWLAKIEAAPSRAPLLRWQWKVSHSLAGSDVRIKQGDDYAARLYVLFDLPLERLSLGDRLRIQASRALSGVDVPAAALCYVWGHAQPAGSSAWNPYTDRVRMVVVDSGNRHAMQWRSASRDLRRDWDEAFGGPMPAIGGIAVGNDTDNTRDRVEAWFGDIVLAQAP